MVRAILDSRYTLSTNGSHIQGLQSFKNLLDQLVSGEGDRKANLEILNQYLESAKPRDTTEDGVYLTDLMEMWSFAVQMNNDGVMSAVVVVLGLILQIVSESLQLVPYGLGICQTLLQEQQLKSISKNLSSEKSKAFIISPTLRMLREAVCLDGGAYAKRIFRARNFTLTSLARNLEIVHAMDAQEDIRKSSVRNHAVRFFLSCLKYLHSDGRRELLVQKDVLSHLTFLIKNDPPYIVLEILETLKSCVLMDDKIPREIKFRSFNTRTLMRLLALYTYTGDAEGTDEKSTVSYQAHQFLLYACTSPVASVMYPSTGLYPKETEDIQKGHENGYMASSTDIPVFNFVLAEFAQKLRPWSNLKHSELLVAIFRAAPELTAKYFLNNRSFTFEPKLSMTWIGYAAFLFDTMRIPLPSHFGDRAHYARAPPPTSIVLDNVIPLPLNQKVFVRCLSSKSHLTSFFATRILIVALEKLAEAIKLHDEAPQVNTKVWQDANRRLMDAFCQRIPDMKEIVRSYKSIPAENLLHRAMTSRLIRLYYEVIPQVALAANFDVSPLFVDVLQKLSGANEQAEDESLGVIELENLVLIASYSPGMRWFSKIDNLLDGTASSPFTALLRLLCGEKHNLPFSQLKKVLGDVAAENQLIVKAKLLQPLQQALQITSSQISTKDMERVWAFVDNCINRCATSPIKYLDLVATYLKESESEVSGDISILLNVAIAEQLPFITNTSKPKELTSIGKFLSIHFNNCYKLRSGRTSTCVLYKRICTVLSSVTMDSLDTDIDMSDETDDESGDEKAGEQASKDRTTFDADKLEEMLHVPFNDEEDNTALIKWATKNVDDLVEDGWAANLIRLLSSSHTNIRKEAFTSILKMAAKIKESSYEEKDQVWLLLSELVESSRSQVDLGAVPSAFTAFAIHALDVLRNPLHPLYPKVNSFLTRSPIWSLEKLPMAHDILHGEPSEDDKYYTEITWLLVYLLDSLRTPFDLGVFHKKRWIEKILTVGSNPYLRSNLRTRILRLVYRATCIDGGSTTLVTRFGIFSWLDAQRAACDLKEDAHVYVALMRRIWETCDQSRVMHWSKGGVEKLLSELIKA